MSHLLVSALLLLSSAVAIASDDTDCEIADVLAAVESDSLPASDEVFTFSQRPDALRLAELTRTALPLARTQTQSLGKPYTIDLSSPASCHRMCRKYTIPLISAMWDVLEAPGGEQHYGFASKDLRYEFSGLAAFGEVWRDVHYFAKTGDLIVDASIQQFIQHPSMRGVFVGTIDDLRAFIKAHPESFKPPKILKLLSLEQQIEIIWGNATPSNYFD